MSTDMQAQENTPVRTKPWPQRGLLGVEEKAAVDALFDEVIASGAVFGYNGPQEEAYCREFAEFMGGGYADGVNSGSNAVYVALHALDLEPFSEVIVGAVTDPGGIMPIPLLNLIPMVADVTPTSFNAGPQQIEELITPYTRAIVIAHIAGEPADMPAIMKIAEKHNLYVIEDTAQAHGATINGQMVGTFGHIAAFSTMSGKHHCTGSQGGVVYTKDESLYWKVRRASDRGKATFGLPAGSTNDICAVNMNSSDLAAVIGSVQLKKLPRIVSRRQELIAMLAEGLKDVPYVALPQIIPGGAASYWFTRMHLNLDTMTCDLPTFYDAVFAEGLTPCGYNYSSNTPHRYDWFTKRHVFGASGYPWASPDYKGDRNRQFPCPNSLALCKTEFNLSLTEAWGEEEIRDVVTIIRKVGEKYSK